jgi:hypothetical protein
VNVSKHTIKKDTQVLVVTSKGTGIKVKAEKTEYSICGHVWRAACRTTAQKIADNKFFERVEHFKHFGTTRTCQIPFVKKLRTD